jgi:hypothetical protein
MVKKIFYARARADKPYIMIHTLKKGKYNEVVFYNLRSFIRFTDIGEILWENMKNMGYDPVIELVKCSLIEEDKSWTVFMYCQGLGILLKSQRYAHFGIYPNPFLLIIEMEGEEETIKGFIKKMVKDMDYEPWEELDWKSLKKKTDLDKADAIKTWSDCLVRGSVLLSSDGKMEKRKRSLEDSTGQTTEKEVPGDSPPKRRRRRRRIS